MIRFIKAVDVLPLRAAVLRNGQKAPQDCVFVGDNNSESFHLGVVQNEQVVCAASFLPQVREGYPGLGYQLRGMATYPEYQSKGLGSKLVRFSLEYLQQMGVDYIWCNAREAAFPFYQNLGFSFISETFDIPGIGPHKAMYLSLKPIK
ncbi:MAG: GNAT family N-acetyltransferase [Sphingobacteriaceae bacterium]